MHYLAHQLNVFWALDSVETGTLEPWCALGYLIVATLWMSLAHPSWNWEQCCFALGALGRLWGKSAWIYIIIVIKGWVPLACTFLHQKMKETKCTLSFIFVFGWSYHFFLAFLFLDVLAAHATLKRFNFAQCYQ